MMGAVDAGEETSVAAGVGASMVTASDVGIGDVGACVGVEGGHPHATNPACRRAERVKKCAAVVVMV